jgi:ribosomal 50S subunit-recycling heat shock protein
MFPAALIAAETIISTGYAYITSSVNKDVFRARAVENALQKIVLESGQDLNSFSIVENGKVLLDQIQTRSAVKVLQYDIIDETIKNKKYHVTVQALLGQDESTVTNNICKKSSVRSIDLSLKVTSNSNDFPAWASISKNWVSNELTGHSFDPKLKINPNLKSRESNTLNYTLFDQKELTGEIKNIYKMNTHIFFERENKNNLFEKNILLIAKIKTKLLRKDKVFAELEFKQPYVIHQKLLNNAFLGATRGDWEKVKKHFSNLLKDHINRQISSLDCVTIPPRVFSKSGIPFIDFGRLDGIGKADMFLIKSNSAKKTYLKIVEIGDHETQVQIVSQQENMASINGKIVELVVGS